MDQQFINVGNKLLRSLLVTSATSINVIVKIVVLMPWILCLLTALMII